MIAVVRLDANSAPKSSSTAANQSDVIEQIDSIQNGLLLNKLAHHSLDSNLTFIVVGWASGKSHVT